MNLIVIVVDLLTEDNRDSNNIIDTNPYIFIAQQRTSPALLLVLPLSQAHVPVKARTAASGVVFFASLINIVSNLFSDLVRLRGDRVPNRIAIIMLGTRRCS